MTRCRYCKKELQSGQTLCDSPICQAKRELNEYRYKMKECEELEDLEIEGYKGNRMNEENCLLCIPKVKWNNSVPRMFEWEYDIELCFQYLKDRLQNILKNENAHIDNNNIYFYLEKAFKNTREYECQIEEE